MTGLIAGYATAIAALLFAAAAAFTIIHNIRPLVSSDEQPAHGESRRKIAA